MRYFLMMLLMPVFVQAQKIEAEDYIKMSGLQTEKTSDSLGGLNVGWIEKGDWMEYNVPVPSGEELTYWWNTFQVKYRIASVSEASLKAGGKITKLPNTGGYQNWVTVIDTVDMDAFPFRITALTAGWNLNWFEITPIKPAPPKEKEDSLWYIDVDRRTFHIIYTDKTSSDTLKLPR